MSMPGGRSHDQNGADEFEGELALTGGDDRLPWLESDDELDQPVVDTGRIAAFALLGLLAVVLVAGSVWFFVLRDDTGQSLVADGSLIEAPAEPYRTRPEDPGGQRVAGTGNASFQVAEGHQVDGRIADMPAPPPPEPSAATVGKPTPAPAPSPVPDGSVGVQVGAYASRTAAQAGWVTLYGRLEALQGRSHRIVEGMADSGRIFRLQALAGSVAEAESLCQGIKAAGGDCQVKR
jgi:hypothetical protein